MGDLNRLDSIYWFLRGCKKPKGFERLYLWAIPTEKLEHDVEPAVYYKQIGNKYWFIKLEDRKDGN